MSGVVTFRTGHFVTGCGAISAVGSEARRLAGPSGERALIVCGNTISKSDILVKMIKDLEEAGLKAEVFAGVEPEPSFETAQACADVLENARFHVVIGIGGGSSLDIAKVAAAAAGQGKIRDFTGVGKIPRKGLPIIAIPTTAGSGSEATASAVLLDRADGGLKKGVVSPYMVPEVSIVDPETTVTVPPGTTAATGMDAMIHALEAFVSRHAQMFTDTLAVQSIDLIANHLRRAYFNGKDIAAREALANGSLLAAVCNANAGLGMVHAIALALGGRFSITHGLANSVLLPYVMEFNLPAAMDKYAIVARIFGFDGFGMSPREAALSAVSGVRNLAGDLGIPATLKELDVPLEAMDRLAEDAIKNTRLLSSNPRQPSLEEMKQVCQKAWHGV